MGLLEDQEEARKRALATMTASLVPAYQVPENFKIREVDPK